MSAPLRFGLKLAGQDTTVEELRAVWQIADEARFDHLWDFDHLASIGAGGPDRPVFEGWSLLAAMAEATRHVRIGAMVTGNTYRHPALLAKIAVTVDHLSAGRLEFGIGAAWAEVEHQMLGIEGLDHRVGRLSESLQILKSLWTEDRTTFDGRYYTLVDAIAKPKPIQKPHPPIWIGAGGERTMRLVARYADVWNPSGPANGEHFAEFSARLDDNCAAIGRDPASIRRSAQYPWNGVDRSELVDLAGRHLDRGCTEQIIVITAGKAAKVAEQVAEALPELRTGKAAGSSVGDDAEAAQEVDLTTFGRTTGATSRRTIWITTDSERRLFIRSGMGPGRDWPQNLLANQRAVLHIGQRDVPVRARHVTDRAELLASRDAVKRKYGRELPSSKEGEPLTLPEQATFELIPE